LGVTLVPCVTHVTYINARCHLPSKVLHEFFYYPIFIKSGGDECGQKVLSRPSADSFVVG
jgi:hypothetical protein